MGQLKVTSNPATLRNIFWAAIVCVNLNNLSDTHIGLQCLLCRLGHLMFNLTFGTPQMPSTFPP